MTKILIPFVDEGAKSIDLPPQSDTTSIQGNERHRRKITRRVVTITYLCMVIIILIV